MAVEKFVATQPLFIGRARVANVGDVVPESHPQLEEWKKADLVAREGTKAAKKAETPEA